MVTELGGSLEDGNDGGGHTDLWTQRRLTGFICCRGMLVGAESVFCWPGWSLSQHKPWAFCQFSKVKYWVVIIEEGGSPAHVVDNLKAMTRVKVGCCQSNKDPSYWLGWNEGLMGSRVCYMYVQRGMGNRYVPTWTLASTSLHGESFSHLKSQILNSWVVNNFLLARENCGRPWICLFLGLIDTFNAIFVLHVSREGQRVHVHH